MIIYVMFGECLFLVSNLLSFFVLYLPDLCISAVSCKKRTRTQILVHGRMCPISGSIFTWIMIGFLWSFRWIFFTWNKIIWSWIIWRIRFSSVRLLILAKCELGFLFLGPIFITFLVLWHHVNHGAFLLSCFNLMQSVGFTAIPFFVIAVAWFVLFAICLFIICLCSCCCRREPYGYSRTAYALSLAFLIFFTISAM